MQRNINKKFQVFVSSTFQDLIEERKEVIQALLELDCIPVGMELFPASDDDQWTLIRNVIKDCDYYILIIGGRYGSTTKEGISYTQKEYEFALQENIPIISFLHKKPELIPVGKTDNSNSLQKQLEAFKLEAQKKMCKYWESPIELGSLVSRSLIRLIKDKPRSGWVKADILPDKDSTEEILSLKNEIELLTQKLEENSIVAPKGTENLAQGEDIHEFNYSKGSPFGMSVFGNEASSINALESTWNEIIAIISPAMLDESSENQLASQLNGFIVQRLNERVNENIDDYHDSSYNSMKIRKQSFQTILVQLKALGIIRKSIKKRSIKDTWTYWQLTPFGENLMMRLRAIKKTAVNKS